MVCTLKTDNLPEGDAAHVADIVFDYIKVEQVGAETDISSMTEVAIMNLMTAVQPEVDATFSAGRRLQSEDL